MTGAGTHAGMGTKASTYAAKRGAAMPSSSSGHAPAAASSAERKIFCVPVVYPKMATTAQSNSALRIRPKERVMNAIKACRIAMAIGRSKTRAAHSRRDQCVGASATLPSTAGSTRRGTAALRGRRSCSAGGGAMARAIGPLAARQAGAPVVLAGKR
jgi:hypothetical protein